MGNAMEPSTVDVYVGDLLFFELRYTHHEAENRQFDCMASMTFKVVLAFGLTHADFSCHWHWSLRDKLCVYNEILRKRIGGALGPTDVTTCTPVVRVEEITTIWLIGLHYLIISDKVWDKLYKTFHHEHVL